MTYKDLLRETARKKEEAIKEINKKLNDPLGFLVKHEIEANPGAVAWHWLAKDFCETLYEHFEEIYDNLKEDYERQEVSDIYMAYYNNEDYLYDLLPLEAQLFK